MLMCEFHAAKLLIFKSYLYLFRMNLCLVKELGDRAAQGRAYGNLGNTQYLLGNFVEAIKFHRQVRTLCNMTILLRRMHENGVSLSVEPKQWPCVNKAKV